MAEKDLYRDTPIRYLGYANEVGESFRSVVKVKWVWLSYGVASAYVLADTFSKSIEARNNTIEDTEKTDFFTDMKTVNAIKTGTDVLVWQGLASVVIPGLVINRICAGTNYALRKIPFKRTKKWITVAVGLSSIPFIIKPIDHLVDYFMDSTFRPFIKQMSSE